ncbi:3-hydroxyacyl-CoA dehydrogenase family protein, partial [Caballeronia sp. SEWSISQ10-4 2]|uniref:3-hydroxyacyl-CoA dehydrogenase family protein n=1 Tax=Caballeronia sp. SEWSISQ10-4 2 TaxID=2937438 RepID=UPI0026516B7C
IVRLVACSIAGSLIATKPENVATAPEIDAGMQLGANQPLGPLALADLIGLDVCLSVMDVFLNDFGNSKYRACPLLREMVAAGKLGRKTGRGVYVYDQVPMPR